MQNTIENIEFTYKNVFTLHIEAMRFHLIRVLYSENVFGCRDFR